MEFSPHDSSIVVLGFGLVSSAVFILFSGVTWAAAGWLMNGLMIGYGLSLIETYWKRDR